MSDDAKNPKTNMALPWRVACLCVCVCCARARVYVLFSRLIINVQAKHTYCATNVPCKCARWSKPRVPHTLHTNQRECVFVFVCVCVYVCICASVCMDQSIWLVVVPFVLAAWLESAVRSASVR